jgi:hypothetical protein
VRTVGQPTGSLRPVLHLRLVGAHSCVIFVAAHMDLDGIVNLLHHGTHYLGLGKDFVRLEAVMWAFPGVEEEKATFLCSANVAVPWELQLAAASQAGFDSLDRDTVIVVSFHQSARRAFD